MPTREELEEQLRIAKEIEALASDEAQIRKLEELIQKEKEYAEVLARKSQIIGENIKASENEEQALKRLNKELLASQSDLYELQGYLQEAKSKGDKETKEAIEALIREVDLQIEAQTKNRDAVKALNEAQKESVKVSDQLKDTLKQIGGEMESGERAGQALQRQLDDIKDAGGGVSAVMEEAFGRSPGFIGDVYRQAKRLKSSLGTVGVQLTKLHPSLARVGQTFVNLAKMPLGQFLPIAGIVLAIGKLVNMGIAVNNLSKSIASATGFGDQFNEEITRMAFAGNMAGIGFEESANAIKSMTEGMSSFNPAAEESNMQVGMTVARLDKLGVSAAASTKTIDHMQRAMGLSATAAANKTAQVARLGKTIGISGTKMIEQFNAASGRLAIFGNNNIKVFKKLAAAAKATGIEMGTLINVSKQFDAFDTAADSAAKLNAVLGTQLSTIELMNANDADRVMMIKQQVQASVGNFDSLDKFTKMYIAQAMGVSDVAEAQRLLNMSTAEYQKYQSGQKESADIQKELTEASESMVPVMQQLKLAFYQIFLGFAPVIEGFAKLLSFMSPFLVGLGQFIMVAVPVVAAGFSIFKVVTGIAAAATLAATPIGWIVAAVLALTGVFSSLYAVFSSKINPVFAQIFHFLGEGLTMMMAPLKFVGKGVSALTGAFSGLFGTAKKDSAALTEGGFDIKAMAEIDTSKIAAGFREVKSAVMELSNIKVNGMLAFTSDGSKTSMIMGSVATEMAMLLNGGKLEVEVKMGEFKVPKIDVKVYIGDTELRTLIRQEVALSHIG